jgi:hypothetical protein
MELSMRLFQGQALYIPTAIRRKLSTVIKIPPPRGREGGNRRGSGERRTEGKRNRKEEKRTAGNVVHSQMDSMSPNITRSQRQTIIKPGRDKRENRKKQTHQRESVQGNTHRHTAKKKAE